MHLPIAEYSDQSDQRCGRLPHWIWVLWSQPNHGAVARGQTQNRSVPAWRGTEGCVANGCDTGHPLSSTITERSLIAMWEEDIVVKKCRWILQQQVALSDKRFPRPKDEAFNPFTLGYRNNVLERERKANERPIFHTRFQTLSSRLGSYLNRDRVPYRGMSVPKKTIQDSQPHTAASSLAKSHPPS